MNLKRKVVILAVSLSIGLVIFFFIHPLKNNQPTYQTAEVQTKDLISTLSVTGNILTGSQTEISSTVDGVVEQLYVSNGDKVKVGQPLFKVKSTATPQQKAAAYATYQTAVSSAKTAEQNKTALDVQMWQKRQTFLNAQNDLNTKNNNPGNYNDLEAQSVDNGLVSAQKDFAAAETKYKEADVALTAAKASLNSAALAYQATQNATITAPTEGVVANLSIQKSDVVSASGNSNSGNNSNNTVAASPALYLTNFTNMEMTAAVNEVDIPKVKVGQKATVTIDAFPDKTFVGQVARIDRIGTTTSGVVTFNVHLTLISIPEEIGSGMTASAVIQLDQHPNVVSIPLSAVNSQGEQTTVRVLTSSNKVEERTIQTGLSTDTDIEVISGLQVGEKVITGTVTPASQRNRTQTNQTSPFSGGLFRGGFGGQGARPR